MSGDSIDSVTFDAYKARSGELERSEFDMVQQHSYSQESYSLAFARLTLAAQQMGAPYPTHADIEVAAKLIGALGQRIPQDLEHCPSAFWLLTESYLLQGKDPDRMHEAIIKSVME